MSIEQDLGKKILVFRYNAPTSSLIVVESIGNFQTESFDPKVLPFPDCTFIHYEPTANLYQIKFGNTELLTMSEAQKTQMFDFVSTLPQMMDLHFPCYDPNKHNLFQGVMSISEAKAKGFVSVLLDNYAAVARYDVDKNIWIPIKAIITDGGRLILDPSSFCDLCVLFLSEEEWDAFPKQPESDEPIDWRWDFELSEWVDVRTIHDVLPTYKQMVLSIFQKMEMLKYAEREMEYFNIIHNPIYMQMIAAVRGQTEIGTILDEVSGNWKDKTLDVFDRMVTTFDTATLTTATAEEFSNLMTSNITADFITFIELMQMSYQNQMLIKYWQTLPEKSFSQGALTKEHVAQFTTMFKTWFTETYGATYID